MKSNYYVVQDGKEINTEILEKFKSCLDKQDTKVYNYKEYWNFVGFIYSGNNLLISFPKHYMGESCIDLYNSTQDNQTNRKFIEKEIDLLFKVIKKAADKDKKGNSIGINAELNHGYPFKAFFEVWNYYKKFGLYTNKNEIKRFTYSGNVDWKDTIRKSNIVFEEDNILFIPMVTRKKVNEQIFLTHAMAYVIDSTLDKFSLFIKGVRTGLRTDKREFGNIDRVIGKLRKIKEHIFKDVEKKLVDNLIDFFKGEKKEGNKYIYLKIYSFNLIWEDMINEYLNKYFLEVSSENKLIFTSQVNDSDFRFKKERIYPDNRKHYESSDKKIKKTRRLEPDHYDYREGKRYIFDAKYYNEVRELNYKQIAYYFLTKNFEQNIDKKPRFIKEKTTTYNALILPTENKERTDIHFDLNIEFNIDEDQFIILEHYLPVKTVMEGYLKLRENK